MEHNKFQFYDSPIDAKGVNPDRIETSMFQFYDSPIDADWKITNQRVGTRI